MDIFGIGVAELFVILIIMLIVAGPKRMIEWAYIMGKYSRSLRKMWGEAMDMVQKELDDAGVDVKVPHDLPNRQNVSRFARDAMKPFTEQVEGVAKELESDMKDVQKDLDEVGKIAKEADPGLKKNPMAGFYDSAAVAAGVKPAATKPEPTVETEAKPASAPAPEQAAPFGTWSQPQNAQANGNGTIAKPAGEEE